MSKKKVTKYALYTDQYFEKGHWSLKIKETLLTSLAWLGVIIPVAATLLTIFAPQVLGLSQQWSREQGVFQLKFMGIILVFAFVMVAIFTVALTIIQNRKRQRLVEQWPTYNPINQVKRQEYLEEFMTERFGSIEERHQTKFYRVTPEQNLDTDQLQQILAKHHVSDL